MADKKPSQKVVSYIEHHLEKGVSIKRIKRALADAGHPIDAIEEATEYVFRMNPHLKKKPKKMMVIYGLILIILISSIGIFAYYKLTETAEYVEEVEKAEEVKGFSEFTDVELLLRAKATGNFENCRHIREHNLKYYCLDKIWDSRPCLYRGIIGANASQCYYELAIEKQELSLCDHIADIELYSRCRGIVVNASSEEEYERQLERENNPWKFENATEENIPEGFKIEPSKEKCFSEVSDYARVYCIHAAAQQPHLGMDPEELVSYYISLGGEDLSLVLFSNEFLKTIASGDASNCHSLNASRYCGTNCPEDLIVEDYEALCLSILNQDLESCSELGLFSLESCRGFIENKFSLCPNRRNCVLYFRFYQ